MINNSVPGYRLQGIQNTDTGFGLQVTTGCKLQGIQKQLPEFNFFNRVMVPYRDTVIFFYRNITLW